MGIDINWPIALGDSASAALVIAIGISAVVAMVAFAQIAIGFAMRGRRSVMPCVLLPPDARGPPKVAILVPAHNERTTLVDTITSLLGADYPSYEIVVVNDGSTDDTLAVLIEAFSLTPSERAASGELPHGGITRAYRSGFFPHLLVVDKVRGGKADALNAAMCMTSAPLVCTVDADCLLDPAALAITVDVFQRDPDRIVAVGGAVLVANGSVVRKGNVTRFRLPRTFLLRLQAIEYFRVSTIARPASCGLSALMIISGAFGLYRRDVLLEVGGYTGGVAGEDMDLVVKIHRFMRDRKRDYAMKFCPDAICWTEAPSTLLILASQRIRWHRGCLETIANHFRMVLNPRYGRIGIVGFGIVLLLEVIAPVVYAVAYPLVALALALDALPIGLVLDAFLFRVLLSGAIGLGAAALLDRSLGSSDRTEAWRG